jgi:hypothetical protein
MKKSKDITKYNLKWQMVRAGIKGTSIPLEAKIKSVNDYFNEEKTKDAHERVLNYLEGLQLGYKGKNQEAVDRIDTEIVKYRAINKDALLKERDSFINLKDAVKYSFEDRHRLWKDLFTRNRKWLEKGYFQKEINDFMDVLYSLFKQNNEEVSKAYSFEKLDSLRKEANKKENTHKFFF